VGKRERDFEFLVRDSQRLSRKSIIREVGDTGLNLFCSTSSLSRSASNFVDSKFLGDAGGCEMFM